MTGRHEKPGAELDRIEADHLRRTAARLLYTPDSDFGPGWAMVPARWFTQVVALLEEVSHG
ncbi:MAG: hypothetical protein M0030_03380 [Actinomycetota bacterium]|nr:hypothetical protein [Actinomycetota bacterium]